MDMSGFSGTVTFGGSEPWFSVDVSSVAFSIGSLEIRWYGIFIAVGLLLALLYAMHYAKSFGIDNDRMMDVCFLSIIIGVIGARLYYVVFNYQKEFAGQPFSEVFRIDKGGLAIYGGIIFGLLSGYFLCKWRKIRALPMLDLASIGFLIGQSIGRWGNFTNQEAFGCNTTLPWGMYSSATNAYLSSASSQLSQMGVAVDPTQPVHPCFLYESIWCLVGFLFIHFVLRKHRRYDGQIFLTYLLWYGLGRFWVEELRTDSLMMGPYRISRFIAGICVVGAAILLVVFRKRRSIFGEEGLRLQLAAEAEEKERRKAAKNARCAQQAVTEPADECGAADVESESGEAVPATEPADECGATDVESESDEAVPATEPAIDDHPTDR